MSKRKLLYSSETILKTMKINTISLKSCQILFQELNFPSEFITIKLFLVFPKKCTTLLEKEKIYNLKQKKILSHVTNEIEKKHKISKIF